MPDIIYAIMRQKRNTYAWFQQNNPVIEDGQIAIISSGQYRGCFKIGNGSSPWASLPWITDYEILFNKPQINGVELTGNKTIEELGGATSAQLIAHVNLTTAHGSTSTPTANRIAMFDANKRLKSGAAPAEADDTVRKAELDAEATARQNADTSHAGLTTAHGSTSTPTANRIAMFDANKRLKSGAAPAAADDTVRKAELDAEATARQNADTSHAGLTTAHGSTSTPTANRIAMFDANKRLKSGAAPAEADDTVRKAELDVVNDLFTEVAIQLEASFPPLIVPLQSPAGHVYLGTLGGRYLSCFPSSYAASCANYQPVVS